MNKKKKIRRPNLSTNSKLFLLGLDNMEGKQLLEKYFELFLRRTDRFVESDIVAKKDF